jgi:ATP-dependent DNA ligase
VPQKMDNRLRVAVATSGQLPPEDGRWAYEPEWDGFRAIVHVNGRAVVWSRRART